MSKILLGSQIFLMLKKAYKVIWVPIMGRLLSFFIPLLEGSRPKKKPTFDIDGTKKNLQGNVPP